MTGRLRDRVLAVLGIALAIAYVHQARGIEDSLLADAVGAGGVPQGVGIALGLASLLLLLKSFIGGPLVATVGSDEAPPGPWRQRLLCVTGLVLILLGYGLLLPLLGYPLSVSLLVLAAGALAGAALRPPLLIAAACAGPALWALFDWLLQVHMPVGTLWG